MVSDVKTQTIVIGSYVTALKVARKRKFANNVYDVLEVTNHVSRHYTSHLRNTSRRPEATLPRYRASLPSHSRSNRIVTQRKQGYGIRSDMFTGKMLGVSGVAVNNFGKRGVYNCASLLPPNDMPNATNGNTRFLFNYVQSRGWNFIALPLSKLYYVNVITIYYSI